MPESVISIRIVQPHRLVLAAVQLCPKLQLLDAACVDACPPAVECSDSDNEVLLFEHLDAMIESCCGLFDVVGKNAKVLVEDQSGAPCHAGGTCPVALNAMIRKYFQGKFGAIRAPVPPSSSTSYAAAEAATPESAAELDKFDGGITLRLRPKLVEAVAMAVAACTTQGAAAACDEQPPNPLDALDAFAFVPTTEFYERAARIYAL